jgi:putative transposase
MKGVDKLEVDEERWREATERATVIRPLIASGAIAPQAVRDACRKLGVRRTRLYELIEQFRASPVVSSLVARRRGPKEGSSRLTPEQDQLIDGAIKEFYRTRQKPSVNALRRRLRQLCHLRGVRPPSWDAIKARVARTDERLLVRDREGAEAASARFAAVVGEYHASCALEVVQIDHTKVDVFVVDSVHREPIGRPWLTLAIDVASRMVAGFYVSLEAPSSTSVALAIQHLVLPKEPWLARLGIVAEWPVAGIPEALHLDNAKEFKARALERGCGEHGVRLIYRPVARPHYGGHIERLIGTMMGAAHLLPGTTFSNVAELGDYDSAKHAVMTLSELERWLALEVVRYHSDLHAALKQPPIAAWRDALAARRAPPSLPKDPVEFLLDFLPFKERAVRRDGVRLFNLRYWDDVLSPWAGRLRRRLRIKYDPRDLSKVFVEDPDGGHWPVRIADLSRPRITLAEHRQAQAVLRARGRSLVDERLIFETIAQQRALEAAATTATRSARRQAERRERALTASARPESTATDAPADDEDYADLLPLKVEEWS